MFRRRPPAGKRGPFPHTFPRAVSGRSSGGTALRDRRHAANYLHRHSPPDGGGCRSQRPADAGVAGALVRIGARRHGDGAVQPAFHPRYRAHFPVRRRGLLVGATKPQSRVFLWGVPTLWLGGHALFHVWEVAVGICAPSALARDFSAVTLPAIIGTLLTFWAAYDTQTGQTGRTVRAPFRANQIRG